MIELVAALAVGLGLALLVVGLLRRARVRQDEILRYLELPFAEEDVDPQDVVERVGLLAPTAGAVDEVLARLDLVERIGAKLERGRVPLRPGEFVLLTAAGTLALALWLALLGGQVVLGVLGVIVGPLLAYGFLARRVSQRERAFEEQLPPTLGLIASSLRSGHTLLRAISMMVEEMPPPMSEEFERVLAETRLGLPLMDALDRMADRVGVEDFEWIVHAIRIQSQTGGKLADLLFTLADYMRAREEVRREVKVLTAEGRFSAFVLAVLPFGVAGWIQFANPDYFSELMNPTGFMLLGAAGLFMAIGIFIITQMIKAVDL
jgi:tight adherence protein B